MAKKVGKPSAEPTSTPPAKAKKHRARDVSQAAIRVATQGKRLRDFALASLSGVLVFLSFPRYDAWPLLWFALVPLLHVIDGKRPFAAFRWGFWAGLVTNWGGFWWVTGMLMDFGHFSLPVAIPLCTLLCAYQGLVFAFWAGGTAWLVQRTRVNVLWVAPLVWVAVEYSIPFVFPWYLANGEYLFYPAIQICEITGVLGLSFLIVLVNVGLWQGVKEAIARRWSVAWKPAAVALAFFTANIIYGVVRIAQVDAQAAAAPKLRIGIGEADVGIFEKEAKHLTSWKEQLAMLRGNILKHHLLAEELEERKVDLIVEPESSFIPVPWQVLPVQFKRSDLFALVGGAGKSLWELRDVKWASRALEATTGVRAISAAREDAVYAVGDDGLVLRYDGKEWTRETVPSRVTLRGVFAVCHPIVNSGGDQIPSVASYRLDGSPVEVFAVGDGGQAFRRQPDGTWSATPTGVQTTIYAVSGDATGHVYAVGAHGLILRWDGLKWQRESADTGASLHAVIAADDGVAIAAGDRGTVLVRKATGWVKDTAGQRHLRGLAFTAGGELVLVGDGGTIVEGLPGRWQTTESGTTADLRAVSVDGRGTLVAVGARGVALERRLGQDAWHAAALRGAGELHAVAGIPYTDAHAYARDARYLYRSHTPLPKVTGKLLDAVSDIGPALASDAGTPGSEWNTPLRGFDTPILLGLLTYDSGGKEYLPGEKDSRKMYNSAMLLDGQGRVMGRYDKNYLLVFGEYIPFGDVFPKLYDMLPEASHFTAGDTVETFAFKGHQIGVMICYEDIIPRFTRNLAGKDPNVLINVTNDAWFGKTSEPYLHLALSIFRSVENRLWLIRSTNTGVSAYVDSVGRIVAETSLEDAEVLAMDVPMLRTSTPYRSYGELFAYGCFIVLAVLVVAALARRKGAVG